MKPWCIIFEGPDATGKTTTAEAVARFFDARLIHTGPPAPEQTAFEAYTAVLDGLQTCHDEVIVFDRFHIGERCYGPALRGRDTLTAAGQVAVEQQLRDQFKPLLVLCRPPFQHALRTWEKRAARGGELTSIADQYLNVWERYLRNERETALEYFVYDFTETSVDNLISQITYALTLRKS